MKYERKCTNCGRTDHYYAKGLCRACYERMRRNGTFKKQYAHGVGSRPDLWSDKTKRILELYRDGMRQVDIVKEVGLTRQAVSLVIKKYTKPSNADRIRSMSDEELAEWATTIGRTFGEEYEGYMSALDWLEQEAKE